MKLLLALAFCASLSLFARGDFLLVNQGGLIVPKSEGFIQNLSSELKSKTGVSLYVVAIDYLESQGKEGRDLVKSEITKTLSPPYGVIFFFQSHRKIDIVLEPSLPIDRNRIISQYMVPILMQDKELTPSKVSASLLNGYAQLADEIASHYGEHLEENLIVDRSGAKDYVHYLIYIIFGVTLGVIALVYFSRKTR